MIRGGKGGSRTLTGLEFEKRVDLRAQFDSLPGYEVRGNDLFFNKKIVARVYKKEEIYSKLLKAFRIDWKNYISSKLLPDETIFIRKNNTIYIIEMKFQHTSGSVDEKLQTCDFKKKQYIKLFSKTKIRVEYTYILSDWFKHKRYSDVMKYIESVGCSYFFEELPFDFLGLPLPHKKNSL
jgi:hypothetical protein